MALTWNDGPIDWGRVDASTNIVQVSTNVNSRGTIYWWRNELPGETLRQCLAQFAQQFPFPTLGCNLASCVAQEWVTGPLPYVIQERQFVATTSNVYLPECD